jgi:hypothetical protein
MRKFAQSGHPAPNVAGQLSEVIVDISPIQLDAASGPEKSIFFLAPTILSVDKKRRNSSTSKKNVATRRHRTTSKVPTKRRVASRLW